MTLAYGFWLCKQKEETTLTFFTKEIVHIETRLILWMSSYYVCLSIFFFQEIGYAHMRIVQGTSSLLQLSGLLAKLCSKAMETKNE